MVKNTLKTSFGKWISSINMKKLSQQVDILNQDYYTKKLTTEAYLKIMLFAQLHETESLHAISDALLDEDFQQALGFQSISASQLSRKNNELDPSLLSTIFFDLIHRVHGTVQNRTENVFRIIEVDDQKGIHCASSPIDLIYQPMKSVMFIVPVGPLSYSLSGSSSMLKSNTFMA